MHEERLARDLRTKLVELAEAARPERIVGVVVWVGALAHLDPASVAQWWPRVVEGTLSEGAKVEVISSDDPNDPRAGGVVLLRVRLGDGSPAPREGSPPSAFGDGMRARGPGAA